MTIDDTFARSGPKLHDMFDDEHGPSAVDSYRPPRTEDRIPRHKNPHDGRPHIWTPDGKQQRYYSRPSSWGKKAEDTKNLSLWDRRVSIDGILSFGKQSEALQLEWAATGEEDRIKRNEIADRAKGLREMADRVGTALHAVTERYDHGLDVRPPAKFKPHLEEWKRLTRFFEIVQMPSGAPGIECFVTMDALRPPEYDAESVIEHEGYKYARLVEYDGSHWSHWVRLAGTFDRLWRYVPCPKCGCRNYIGDFKSGAPKDYNEGSFAVQTGVYSGGKEYVPWENGQGADRYDLPDVCRHRGIIVYVDKESALGMTKWVNLGAGYNAAIGLIPQITAHRRVDNWMRTFVPVPDMWAAVDAAQTPEEVSALWKQYPDQATWTPELINYAAARKTLLLTGELPV